MVDPTLKRQELLREAARALHPLVCDQLIENSPRFRTLRADDIDTAIEELIGEIVFHFTGSELDEMRRIHASAWGRRHPGWAG